ncbi:MAG TPA: M15 family metallopeptidase, partial [Kofleriaceae bacterium]|nr:M15 family metallopeptidase [Kofleriaceae bacterium]
ALLFAGCNAPGDLDYGEHTSEISVGGAVTSSCSTATVRGLSLQIAREVDCMTANSLVEFAASSRIRFASSAVLPYLHANAKADLIKAGADATLVVNSGYRTVAQQYLLYRWDQLGRCGISVAAPPGRSNHESGRAIDLGNWSSRVTVMRNHRFSHSVPGDPVHFDHTSSPDNRGDDVRAFQRLWNRNHPGDTISVDGEYGPQTAARLKASPATGFAKGPLCKSIVVDSPVLAVDGPDRIAPGTRSKYVFTLANLGEIDWAASTRIVVVDGGASELYDDDTWTSPSELGTLGIAISAGGKGDFGFEIAAPEVTEATPMSTTFALVDATGATRETFELHVTVTPDGDDGTSTDDADHEADEIVETDEDGVETGGGCSSSGGGAGLSGLAVALLALRRRRASR